MANSSISSRWAAVAIAPACLCGESRGGHEPDLIEAALLAAAFRQQQMPIMNRIETATKACPDAFSDHTVVAEAEIVEGPAPWRRAPRPPIRQPGAKIALMDTIARWSPTGWPEVDRGAISSERS